jgi:molybdopterin-guanine dinucleotide biosynthesis protein A
MSKEKTVNRSAIVIAGGFSSRFGQDKGVLKIANKPLIRYVVDAVSLVVDETVVVTNSQERVMKYAKITGSDVKFAVDVCKLRSPLVGALTGFGVVHGKYSVLLPFDTPFVSCKVVSLLFELCVNRPAVIPWWPNGNIEPLHAVYQTEQALKAAKSAVAEEKLNMRGMIEKLRGVSYVSTMVIQQLDPDLRTFFNINTPADLEKAMTIVRARKRK